MKGIMQNVVSVPNIRNGFDIILKDRIAKNERAKTRSVGN
jgi:hypothetical protein